MYGKVSAQDAPEIQKQAYQARNNMYRHYYGMVGALFGGPVINTLLSNHVEQLKPTLAVGVAAVSLAVGTKEALATLSWRQEVKSLEKTISDAQAAQSPSVDASKTADLPIDQPVAKIEDQMPHIPFDTSQFDQTLAKEKVA